jgi:hypothetical protein
MRNTINKTMKKTPEEIRAKAEELYPKPQEGQDDAYNKVVIANICQEAFIKACEWMQEDSTLPNGECEHEMIKYGAWYECSICGKIL